MTFSICVREHYTDDEGLEQTRFGVAVTTRLAGVGTLCPFVSENGAVATQGLVDVDLGRRGIAYLDDGLAVEDALQALLNADDGAASRQLHGVDADGTFAFSGEDCEPWYGHREGPNYTVAGNLLTGEAVVDVVAEAYETSAPSCGADSRVARDAERPSDRESGASPREQTGSEETRETGDREEPLPKRLVDALEVGHEAGGDRREDLPVQSAALCVATTEDRPIDPAFEDLRVDATETPIADLRATYELAVQAHEDAMARYGNDDEVNDPNGGDG